MVFCSYYLNYYFEHHSQVHLIICWLSIVYKIKLPDEHLHAIFKFNPSKSSVSNRSTLLTNSQEQPFIHILRADINLLGLPRARCWGKKFFTRSVPEPAILDRKWRSEEHLVRLKAHPVTSYLLLKTSLMFILGLSELSCLTLSEALHKYWRQMRLTSSLCLCRVSKLSKSEVHL